MMIRGGLARGGCHVEIPHRNGCAGNGGPRLCGCAFERGRGEALPDRRPAWGRAPCREPGAFAGWIAPRPSPPPRQAGQERWPKTAGNPRCHRVRRSARQCGGARADHCGGGAGRHAPRRTPGRDQHRLVESAQTCAHLVDVEDARGGFVDDEHARAVLRAPRRSRCRQRGERDRGDQEEARAHALAPSRLGDAGLDEEPQRVGGRAPTRPSRQPPRRHDGGEREERDGPAQLHVATSAAATSASRGGRAASATTSGTPR